MGLSLFFTSSLLTTTPSSATRHGRRHTISSLKLSRTPLSSSRLSRCESRKPKPPQTHSYIPLPCIICPKFRNPLCRVGCGAICAATQYSWAKLLTAMELRVSCREFLIQGILELGGIPRLSKLTNVKSTTRHSPANGALKGGQDSRRASRRRPR